MPRRPLSKLTTLLLLLSLCVGALSSCGGSLVRTYEDPNGETARGFTAYLESGRRETLGVRESGDAFTLELTVVRDGAVDFTIPVGRTMVFRVDGASVEVPTSEASPPVTSSGGEVSTQWTLRAATQPYTIRALAAGPIESIRVVVDGEAITLTPDATQRPRIKASLAELDSTQ